MRLQVTVLIVAIVSLLLIGASICKIGKNIIESHNIDRLAETIGGE